jgi:hypothetical protein
VQRRARLLLPADCGDLAKLRANPEVLPGSTAVPPSYHAFGPYRTVRVPQIVLLDRTVPTRIDPTPTRKKECENAPAMGTIKPAAPICEAPIMASFRLATNRTESTRACELGFNPVR